MTPTEFLRDRNIVTKDKTDLIIGFDNGTKESLIELLEKYHQAKLKLLGITSVSNSSDVDELKCPLCNDADTLRSKRYLMFSKVCKNCGTHVKLPTHPDYSK